MAIHILPNISRSKGSQTMKFGQLIEYNTRNTFLEKSYTKFGEETIPRPFSKKSKLSICLNQQSKVLYSFFLIVCQVEGYRYILKLSRRPLAFTSYKAFSKSKRRFRNFCHCHSFVGISVIESVTVSHFISLTSANNVMHYSVKILKGAR